MSFGDTFFLVDFEQSGNKDFIIESFGNTFYPLTDRQRLFLSLKKRAHEMNCNFMRAELKIPICRIILKTAVIQQYVLSLFFFLHIGGKARRTKLFFPANRNRERQDREQKRGTLTAFPDAGTWLTRPFLKNVPEI